MACYDFKPDHNGECTNCDEWIDAHDILQRGDFVRVSAHGTTKDAMVGLASPNGNSVILLFDGGLFWPGTEGGYAGSMPILRLPDGQWVELINQRPITLERRT